MMRLRGGFRRIAALVVGGPRYSRRCRHAPAVAAGHRPRGARAPRRPAHLVEVVSPRAWTKVMGWTDGAGRFFLFMARRGAAHTLRVERSGCSPAVVEGVHFEGGPRQPRPGAAVLGMRRTWRRFVVAQAARFVRALLPMLAVASALVAVSSPSGVRAIRSLDPVLDSWRASAGPCRCTSRAGWRSSMRSWTS